jgi:pimeloyl-ACP methyl ester carboxylesterase
MSKATFVLIHGGCHRASCWDRLIPALEALGRRAVAVDLPGHGRDPARDPAPKTLDDGIAATVAAIRPIEGSVILVGHSLGGMTISGAAERVPDRIERLVYLTALVPRDGESTAAFAGLAGFNAEIGSVMLDDGERIAVRPDRARHLFYADCDAATADAAICALVPTDIGYLTTPVSLTDGRFGQIPKTYIRCLSDNAIEPEAQRFLAAIHSDADHREIDASHSAFLSKPAELAALFDSL